ncbi:MAG: ribonuclease III family protein [Candidatus Bathyarchaeia archaeon]
MGNELRRVLVDRDLAALGDAFVNLVYSLASSKQTGRPQGLKVRNRVLAEAVRLAGLRELLPGRLDRHTIGNSAEALLAYACLERLLSVDECAEMLMQRLDEPEEAFARLLTVAVERVRARGRAGDS